MRNRFQFFTALGCALLFALTLCAEERHLGQFLSQWKGSESGPFCVNVRCSNANNTYRPGELVQVFVTSEKNGYVTIYDGKNQQVFPNQYYRNNTISAGEERVYPPQDAPFQWKFDGKNAQETLTICVSETPLAGKDLITELKNSLVTVQLLLTIGESAPVPEPAPQPDPDPEPEPAGGRYFAMFIQSHLTDVANGEWMLDGNYHFRIGNGIFMRHAFLHVCKCQELAFVTGPEFTKRNIRKTFHNLQEQTKPGDEIFIYWESHGGPYEGVGNPAGEADGISEVLLLSTAKYDRVTETQSITAEDILTDDEFAELVTSLKDRKVTIIMEACFSGGMVESVPTNMFRTTSRNLNFRNETENTENIGDIICDLSSQPKDLDPVWTEASYICNYNDIPSNRMFVSNRTASGAPRNVFMKRFFQNVKDLSQNQKNLAMFMSSSENESSWCAVMNPNTQEAFALQAGVWGGEAKIYLIGAPTYSFLLTLVDSEGKFTQSPGHPTFDDFTRLAARLIPANNVRMVRAYPDVPKFQGYTQVPRSINNIGKVLLIP